MSNEQAKSSGLVIDPDTGERLPAGPTVTTIKLPSEATGGRFSVVEYELAPGFPGPPAHVHSTWSHVFRVLEGSITVTLDGQEETVETGGLAWIPAGVVHSFGNPGEATARVLTVDAPGGFEGYYAELSAAIPAGAPPDPEKIAEIQRRFDTYPPGEG